MDSVEKQPEAFRTRLKEIAAKYKAKHADLEEVDLAFDSDTPRTPSQIVRHVAESPIAVNNLLPYLAEVRSTLGIDTKPILKSMISNMAKVKTAFPKEYAVIHAKTGSRDITSG